MLTFNLRYFLLALLFFVIEVMIALYVHDAIVRPYIGDYLVVMLIYCAVRSFIKAPTLIIAIGVLLFSYTIELLQYFHIVDRLGLANNAIAKTVLGYGFEWWDLLAYTLGVVTVLALDKSQERGRRAKGERAK